MPRRDPSLKICTVRARNGGVYCLSSDDCSRCGWNPEVEARRKAAINAEKPTQPDLRGTTPAAATTQTSSSSGRLSRVCIEPSRNGGVYCSPQDDCSRCGWNPLAEERRKKKIKTTPPTQASPKKAATQPQRR